MKVELIRVTQDPVGAIEHAACNCYDSKPAGGKIMEACYRSGHTSVLEFAEFHFHIEGVSRSLLAQITRHRHAGFAVRSQRYCVEDGGHYITPPSIERSEARKRLYDASIKDAFYEYENLINEGVAPEDARYLLPNACETHFDMVINLRSLINFMNERLCTRAQWEIRSLAQEMKRIIVLQYPALEHMLVPKCEKNKDLHFCPESKSCGRHKTAIEIAREINQRLDLMEKNPMHFSVPYFPDSY